MKVIILTNNPKILEGHFDKAKIEILYDKISFMAVLLKARDMIHRGHKLLTHPLSGSVKPNETPYKSIMLSKKSTSQVDFDSLKIIEQSIETTDKFLRISNTPSWAEKILEDFSVIDDTLIKGALSSIL